MFKKIIKFFQLSDRAGNLSLTNIALIIVLVKIAISPFDYTGVALLLPVIASYMHKRHESNKAAKEEQSKLPNASEVLKEVKELKAKLDEQSKELEAQSKVVEEAKSMLTATKISSGIKRQL